MNVAVFKLGACNSGLMRGELSVEVGFIFNLFNIQVIIMPLHNYSAVKELNTCLSKNKMTHILYLFNLKEGHMNRSKQTISLKNTLTCFCLNF